MSWSVWSPLDPDSWFGLAPIGRVIAWTDRQLTLNSIQNSLLIHWSPDLVRYRSGKNHNCAFN